MSTYPTWYYVVMFSGMAIGWSMAIWAAWCAADATDMENFAPPAFCAGFISFLFMGPFCLVMWYALILKMITLGTRQ